MVLFGRALRNRRRRVRRLDAIDANRPPSKLDILVMSASMVRMGNIWIQPVSHVYMVIRQLKLAQSYHMRMRVICLQPAGQVTGGSA